MLHKNKLTIFVVSQSHITLPVLRNLRNVTQEVYVTCLRTPTSFADWLKTRKLKVETFVKRCRERSNNDFSITQKVLRLDVAVVSPYNTVSL